MEAFVGDLHKNSLTLLGLQAALTVPFHCFLFKLSLKFKFNKCENTDKVCVCVCV